MTKQQVDDLVTRTINEIKNKNMDSNQNPNPTTPTPTTPIEPAAKPRQKFTGMVSSNSVRVKAPKRTDVARLSFAVNTKLSDLPKLVAQWQKDIDAAVKAGTMKHPETGAVLTSAPSVIEGSIYAQISEPQN